MTTIFKKFATGTAALALMTTVFATGAMADDVQSTITGGNMNITGVSASTFGDAVTLDGSTQTVTGAAISTFNVTDARGTGAGWNVAVSATPFLHNSNTKTLSAGSLTLAAPEVTKIDTNSSAETTVTPASGPIDGGSVKVLSAEADGGMGSYTISAMAMSLELKPKEVYAGTYTSTVNVELTTGP
ncbi:WxL domain-containing protein [Planococcus sp. X10-3]|uniref:WxL domain-containing protein n=1 Tax=Planococcus sp. X10-3 TaxID=3061240 RepID=UPI003BB14283